VVHVNIGVLNTDTEPTVYKKAAAIYMYNTRTSSTSPSPCWSSLWSILWVVPETLEWKLSEDKACSCQRHILTERALPRGSTLEVEEMRWRGPREEERKTAALPAALKVTKPPSLQLQPRRQESHQCSPTSLEFFLLSQWSLKNNTSQFSSTHIPFLGLESKE